MKKLLNFALFVLCIVDIDKIKASNLPSISRTDKLTPQGPTSGNRLQQFLGKKTPDGLKRSLEKKTQASLELAFQEDEQQTNFDHVRNQLDIADYGDGVKLVGTKQGNIPKIIFTKPEKPNLEFSPRTDLPDQDNFDAGHTITKKQDGAVLSVRHFDAAGKETMRSQLNNSFVVKSLQSAGKAAADFISSKQNQIQSVFAMPSGKGRFVAEQALTTDLVDQAVENQNISFTVKQQLWQDTYNQAKKLFSQGELNGNVLRAWVSYPFDRMTEYRLSSKKSTVTISRNPITGVVTMETISADKVNQKVFEGGQLTQEKNYKGPVLVSSMKIIYDQFGKKVLTTELLYNKDQAVEYVVHEIFDAVSGQLKRKQTLDTQGNPASPSLAH